MPEERTTSGQAPATPPQGGQVGRTSPGDQPGRSEQRTQETGQAPEKKADKPGKVNLYELPEFRQYQTSVQQTLEKERAKAQELEQRLRQVEEAGLSDYDKAVKEAERARQELGQIKAERAQEQEMMRLQQQIHADKQRLSQRFGIPMAELDTAGSYDEAEEMAIEYFKASVGGGSRGQAEEDEAPSAEQRRRAANRPNLSTGTREVSAAVDKARTAWEGKDPQAYIRAVREGKESGAW